MKAKYKHDCDCCNFLGHYEEHDLYYCSQDGGIPTVIARWGNDGHDYSSGLSFVNHIPVIAEASRRAIDKGYLTQKTVDFWTK